MCYDGQRRAAQTYLTQIEGDEEGERERARGVSQSPRFSNPDFFLFIFYFFILFYFIWFYYFYLTNTDTLRATWKSFRFLVQRKPEEVRLLRLLRMVHEDLAQRLRTQGSCARTDTRAQDQMLIISFSSSFATNDKYIYIYICCFLLNVV